MSVVQYIYDHWFLSLVFMVVGGTMTATVFDAVRGKR